MCENVVNTQSYVYIFYSQIRYKKQNENQETNVYLSFYLSTK